MRQCVLPVERGGVDGCVGDAEAEEVVVNILLSIVIIMVFFIIVLIAFSIGQQDCNSEECPEWNPWSEWTQCRF